MSSTNAVAGTPSATRRAIFATSRRAPPDVASTTSAAAADATAPTVSAGSTLSITWSASRSCASNRARRSDAMNPDAHSADFGGSSLEGSATVCAVMGVPVAQLAPAAAAAAVAPAAAAPAARCMVGLAPDCGLPAAASPAELRSDASPASPTWSDAGLSAGRLVASAGWSAVPAGRIRAAAASGRACTRPGRSMACWKDLGAVRRNAARAASSTPGQKSGAYLASAMEREGARSQSRRRTLSSESRDSGLRKLMRPTARMRAACIAVQATRQPTKAADMAAMCGGTSMAARPHPVPASSASATTMARVGAALFQRPASGACTPGAGAARGQHSEGRRSHMQAKMCRTATPSATLQPHAALRAAALVRPRTTTSPHKCPGPSQPAGCGAAALAAMAKSPGRKDEGRRVPTATGKSAQPSGGAQVG
mmetsp:Transcript_5245/g.22302  ORF Transcript_5245/g.22302 Transcript_5245/m.22302 type:complete len:425 (+) Transcript_5245:2789-4063(+)